MAALISNRHKRGFTLIELVVVTGLIGFLSVGMVGLFLNTIRGNYRAKLEASIKEQGDAAIVAMERTIRNSQTFPACSGTQVLFTQPGIATNQYGYQFAGGTIQQTIDGGSHWNPILGYNLGNNVDVTVLAVPAPSFTCFADATGFTRGKVRIQFTLRAANTSGTLDQAFETTVAIRTTQ